MLIQEIETAKSLNFQTIKQYNKLHRQYEKEQKLERFRNSLSLGHAPKFLQRMSLRCNSSRIF